MARRLQLLRGTTAQNNSYTGGIGEITYDTDAKMIRIHDGVTPGGFTFVSNNMVQVQHPTAENGYTWYRLYSDGWVEQGGMFNTENTGGWQSNLTVNLPIEMDNIYYHPTWTSGWNVKTADAAVVNTRTTSSFVLSQPLCYNSTSPSTWEVKGMASATAIADILGE